MTKYDEKTIQKLKELADQITQDGAYHDAAIIAAALLMLAESMDSGVTHLSMVIQDGYGYRQ